MKSGLALTEHDVFLIRYWHLQNLRGLPLRFEPVTSCTPNPSSPIARHACDAAWPAFPYTYRPTDDDVVVRSSWVRVSKLYRPALWSCDHYVELVCYVYKNKNWRKSEVRYEILYQRFIMLDGPMHGMLIFVFGCQVFGQCNVMSLSDYTRPVTLLYCDCTNGWSHEHRAFA